MLGTLFGSFVDPSAMLAWLGELALLVGGLTLVAAGVQAGHEVIERRVNLVMLGGQPPPATAKPAPQSSQLSLFRLPGEGVADKEQRFIIYQLARLRIPPVRALSFYAAGRLLVAVGFGVAAVFALRTNSMSLASALFVLLAATGAAAGGWLLLPVLVRVGARQRADAAAAGLPEALDLLVVCLDSGLSLEDSLTRVVGELDLARAPLAEELALTLADLQILPSRDEALEKMAERLDLPSVRTFVATLTQTLRYGTPLSHALRTIAAELRNDAMIQLEERTNKLPALLTVPLMLFIMPTIFLIIGGPAFLRLLDVWR